MTNHDMHSQAVNTIRFLAADAIQQANSGHPGLPMGTAAIAYTLWTRHLNHNPANPQWANRDRFVLSGGHGSMLLYALLHLTGYDLSLDEIKNFRQWDSKTPGHPEYGVTPGVEVTTGPLGQGFANGVGMAIAQAHLASRFNKPDQEIFDHYIYAIVTDGDLMEGVAAEAASLAGHLQLGKLIYLYDDNKISIDGSTDIAFTEDRGKRFESYGWHVQTVNDGNALDEIDQAIQSAQNDPRPSIVICKTTIGFGMPNKQGTAHAHGEPPGKDELAAAKDHLDWPQEPRFLVPPEILEHFRMALEKGKTLEANWETSVAAYTDKFPELGQELSQVLSNSLPENWEAALPTFDADQKGLATRNASGAVINALAPHLPGLIGGSADLAPSNKTWIKDSPDFQPATPEGRNFHFGVREHGMGAVVNGMSMYPGIIPYGGTFLVFSDYMRGAMRVGALSHYPTIWIFTHDSIGVGEDGPTHQPVEHLVSLRAIPNLVTLRPGDANEVSQAWKVAIQRRNGPTALLLTRQNVPTLDRSIFAPASNLEKGAYILADLGDNEPEMILMASGSEVGLIVAAGQALVGQGRSVRLVSFPSWELFEAQDQIYKDSVLLPSVTKRLAVEAGISLGWAKYAANTITLDHYGASAPANIVFDKFGFTVENIVNTAMSL